MTYLEILVKLRKIIRSINLESKKIEKMHGISIPQLLCLQYLLQQENHQASASEIKSYINLNASTVSGIISRLQAKNLISKTPHTTDRRITYIKLTNSGEKLLKTSPITLQEKLADQLVKLSDDQIEELDRNIDLLVKIMGVEGLEAAPVITLGELP